MMRNCYGFKILILLAATALPLTGCKDHDSADRHFQIDQENTKGDLTVRLRATSSSITMAQTLTLELQATVEHGRQAVMPDLSESLKDFEIVDWRNLGDKLDENGNVVTTYTYRLSPLKTGDMELPSLIFASTLATDAKDTDIKNIRLQTEPVTIEVLTLLDDPDQTTIADIEDVMPMSLWHSWWPFAGAAAIVIILVAIILLRAGKKPRSAPKRIYKSAHQLACELLHRLLEAKLIEKGRTKEFYERISNILRHYIEDRFSLMAPERTTEEFLYELQYNRSELTVADKEALAEFLKHCDLVKFAKHQPTADQVKYTVELAEDFIAKTRSEDYQVDITEKTEDQTIDQAEI